MDGYILGYDYGFKYSESYMYGFGFGIIFLPNLKIGYGPILFGARDLEYSDNHILIFKPTS